MSCTISLIDVINPAEDFIKAVQREAVFFCGSARRNAFVRITAARGGSYNKAEDHEEVMVMAPIGPAPHPPINPPPDAPPIYPTGTTIPVCLFAFTYVWTKSGEPFWFYPIEVNAVTASGYRWTGLFWMFSVLDLSTVEGVACSRR